MFASLLAQVNPFIRNPTRPKNLWALKGSKKTIAAAAAAAAAAPAVAAVAAAAAVDAAASSSSSSSLRVDAKGKKMRMQRHGSTVEKIGGHFGGGSPTGAETEGSAGGATSFPIDQGAKRIVNSIHDSVSFSVDLDADPERKAAAGGAGAAPARRSAAAAAPASAAAGAAAPAKPKKRMSMKEYYARLLGDGD